MTVSSKRPENIAIVSLVLSVVFFGIAFFLGQWSGFFALSAISWLILSSALIWLVLSVQFHQRSLAEREKLESFKTAANVPAYSPLLSGICKYSKDGSFPYSQH